MAKRSGVQNISPEGVKPVETPKPAIAFDTVSNYNKVTVMSKIDGKYSCTCASGNHYVWPCIGSTVLVDEKDDQYLWDYGRAGDQTKNYPSIPLPTSAKVIDRVTVTKA